MARSEKASVSAARRLVVVIGTVTAAFLLATLVTQDLDNKIAARANIIVGDAMPSVRLLTEALSELDRIEFDLDQYARASRHLRPELRNRFMEDERRLSALVNSYALLPFFPMEATMFGPVIPELEVFSARVEGLSDATPAEIAELDRHIDSLEQLLRGLVEINAVEGQRLGLEIVRIRERTKWIVAVLDAACAALAILAAILAVRLMRRSVRALEEARTAGEQREAELASLAESLGQFSGRVAHDIRSPLSSAMLALELLQQKYASDAQSQRVTTAGVNSILSVQKLVDGLLAFSQAGGRPESGAATELESNIADVVEEMRDAAAKEHITIELAPVPKGRIACSAGVLTSLLSNLVRNSIRYMGDSRTRRIDVRVGDVGARWRVEVQDTGPGIPEVSQRRIFEPHVQLGRGGEGIGLGLATVDRLVRAHGGSLGVISHPPGGALFWFELPKAVPDSVTVAHRALQPAPA